MGLVYNPFIKLTYNWPEIESSELGIEILEGPDRSFLIKASFRAKFSLSFWDVNSCAPQTGLLI